MGIVIFVQNIFIYMRLLFEGGYILLPLTHDPLVILTNYYCILVGVSHDPHVYVLYCSSVKSVFNSLIKV